LPPVFDELLRQRIAANPETAACEWHVVMLDIAKPYACPLSLASVCAGNARERSTS
jgi:hypothetical protein